MANRYLKLISYLVFISLIGLYSCSSSTSKSEIVETPDDINNKLVKIENDIYILMDEGDTKKALQLVGQLNHPSNDNWSSKRNLFKLTTYTYNEWWNERRESIRKEILEKAEENKLKKSSQKNKDENQQVTSYNQSQTDSLATKVSEITGIIDERYFGLYLLASGEQLFKFSKNNNSNELNIMHQDNSSGQIKIENYVLKTFNESTGELQLENKKDAQVFISIFFKSEPQSTNGYKLVDNQGNSYEFVSK